MTFKGTVDIRGIQPPLVLGLHVADQVYRDNGLEMVITSVCDGTHSANSLHYKGLASDLRLPSRSGVVGEVPTDKEARLNSAVLKELKNKLGPQWDVILEADPAHPDNDHIHAEFDPKTPAPKPT